ncbi:MAG: hypothetical protein ACRC4M_05790 [Mycoplasma sp.]
MLPENKDIKKMIGKIKDLKPRSKKIQLLNEDIVANDDILQNYIEDVIDTQLFYRDFLQKENKKVFDFLNDLILFKDLEKVLEKNKAGHFEVDLIEKARATYFAKINASRRHGSQLENNDIEEEIETGPTAEDLELQIISDFDVFFKGPDLTSLRKITHNIFKTHKLIPLPILPDDEEHHELMQEIDSKNHEIWKKRILEIMTVLKQFQLKNKAKVFLSPFAKNVFAETKIKKMQEEIVQDSNIETENIKNQKSKKRFTPTIEMIDFAKNISYDPTSFELNVIKQINSLLKENYRPIILLNGNDMGTYRTSIGKCRTFVSSSIKNKVNVLYDRSQSVYKKYNLNGMTNEEKKKVMDTIKEEFDNNLIINFQKTKNNRFFINVIPLFSLVNYNRKNLNSNSLIIFDKEGAENDDNFVEKIVLQNGKIALNDRKEINDRKETSKTNGFKFSFAQKNINFAGTKNLTNVFLSSYVNLENSFLELIRYEPTLPSRKKVMNDKNITYVEESVEIHHTLISRKIFKKIVRNHINLNKRKYTKNKKGTDFFVKPSDIVRFNSSLNKPINLWILGNLLHKEIHRSFFINKKVRQEKEEFYINKFIEDNCFPENREDGRLPTEAEIAQFKQNIKDYIEEIITTYNIDKNPELLVELYSNNFIIKNLFEEELEKAKSKLPKPFTKKIKFAK